MNSAEIEPLGDCAFLARFAGEAAARFWAAAVRALQTHGVTDVVLAYRTVAVFADPARVDLFDLESRLRAVVAHRGSQPAGRSLAIPVLYDGADLFDVAMRLDLSPAEVIGLHTSAEYRVHAIGFLPGFPYAGELPSALAGLPRRETPRLRVPAGSVAIVDRQTAIYPCDSPGGWHLLGTTPLCIADPEDGYFPIRAGDRIRFEPISASEFEAKDMIAFRDEPTDDARCIDLNADLGEGFPNDKALLELVSSASICCGAHAGSPAVIQQTLRDAAALGVVVGAHPGYPDRDGFGRREQSLTLDELFAEIRAQLEILCGLAGEVGIDVKYLKPHGALYNQAQRESDVARPLALAAVMYHLPLLGQPGSVLERRAHLQHVPFIPEGFPDRRYRTDGSLVPRSEPDAVLDDRGEIEAQVLRLVCEGNVATLCIHGDDRRAVANAMIVRSALEEAGVVIRSFLPGSA